MSNTSEKFSIIGEVVEHLSLNKKEWLTLKLPDGTIYTINKEHCSPVKEELNDRTNGKSTK